MMKILAFINSDYSSWGLMVQFGILSLMLLVANIIRRKVKVFRTLLFPTAIIAGFLGLGLKYLIIGLNVTIQGEYLISNSFLEGITYHAIAIGFIAMGLKSVKKEGTNELKGRPFKTGLIIVSTYLIQGAIGVIITMVMFNFFKGIAPFSGLLLPMGFGQGPGQANNIGGIFEQNGFIGGKSFGLAIATIGTIWSSVLGIYYINKKSGEGKVKRAREEESKDVTNEVIESKNEIPVSEAIDKMSIQIIFVAVVYLFSYLFMEIITTLIKVEAITGLIWGFNFIFGMLFALVFKVILNFLQKKGWMKRKYTNEYMLNRITGVVFDYMIVASIMAINVSMIAKAEFWITLLVLTTIGGFVTYYYLRLVVKKTYPDYEHEAFAALFGNLTGTASNGIALLREIDPDFKTPASDDLVTGSSTAVLFGAPILLITGIIYLDGWYYLWGSLALMIVLFFVFFYFLIRKDKAK